ncbi:RES family NAD+ phosphorylase [Vibrio sp. TRT 21S02]|uniref:RES family NAD+ phosphorylase n=1 Tax=Vibrio sp. TRT 21S02 TaxID=3418507 RepID=UPI003CEC1362
MGLKNKKSTLTSHRLVNTKYPPIDLFESVANPEDFEILYAIQALTNPRLRDEVGDIALIDPNDIPYQCERGRSYAVGPFTHINPNGGRFNDGFFGALYVADTEQTAVQEVKHHQQKYWANVEGLAYDRFLFRSLVVTHCPNPVHLVQPNDKSILDPNHYSASQQLAKDLKKDGFQAVQYPSVRHQGGMCWALFTPKPVQDVIQGHLVEMIWNGEQIAEINEVKNIES